MRNCLHLRMGSKKTYDFIDKNEICVSLPVDETNLTEKIALNRKVVSINNCLQIDLTGQVASESSAYRHISGTGGQLQFVRGAFSRRAENLLCAFHRGLLIKKVTPYRELFRGWRRGQLLRHLARM